MSPITKENKKILDFAYNFSNVVKRERWVSRYDVESDSFFLTAPKLPNNARIKYYSDEVAFYVTPSNDVRGIFVEYFKSNFIKHHKDFKKLLEDVAKEKEATKTLIELKKSKVNKMAPEFEDIIQESLAENVKIEPMSS